MKGSAQGQGHQTTLQVHNYNSSASDEDGIVTPVKPSAKALGKRKVVEPIEHERESFLVFRY